MQVFRWGLFALAGMFPAVLAVAAAPKPGMSDGIVKIGVLGDMSGIFSDLSGKGSVIAAQMAIDDFVAKSKPSFNIELVSADHLNKADVAANAAREWYDAEHVDMITDAINSAVALAVSQITETKNRLLIVTGAGTTRLTNEQCSPNTVSYTWDTYAFSNGQARIIKTLGLDTWFFIAVDYALGKSLVENASDAIQKAGGKVVGTVYYPIGAADYSSYVLQAQGSMAKVVAIANAGTDLHNAIRAAKDFDITSQQTVVPLVGTITDVHALGASAMQGMILVEPFYWNLDDQARNWSLKFQAKYGKMPNFIHAGTYSAVMTYLEAVQAAGTDEPAAVMRQLKSMKINDMFARNGHIRADGRMVHDMYLVKVKNPAEVKEPWDYYEVKQTIPADEAFQPLTSSKCRLVGAGR